ncbi:MAG: precorrin-6Y C5,15-methyltransferase (decarboxylating) subunit CbiT [Nitrosopumilus sp. H8]|nr:MAG: precorrin-6Y C5,15-methyltransferase (decarboxylating) subunit CbiT [Nitrosopumilus sp. H13]RNJ78166.1 MAG: precorrin-6Y C5,15-methyltransferase (decarboxylating) subunit CbiT [Nitrosopumilus sp. H8]
MWNFKTPGIPDELFERVDKVPITKEEVRAVQISKARLRPGHIIYDVGCGSGSVSVEAALQVESGRVIAIDRDENAISLARKNAEKFGLSNISLVHGNALECIGGLDTADAIFVGGTGGDTAGIVRLCQDKLRPGGRIVIGTILIETLHAVLKELEMLQFDSVDITQVTVSKSKKTSTGTMMLARNPVTIVSATRSQS